MLFITLKFHEHFIIYKLNKKVNTVCFSLLCKITLLKQAELSIIEANHEPQSVFLKKNLLPQTTRFSTNLSKLTKTDLAGPLNKNESLVIS